MLRFNDKHAFIASQLTMQKCIKFSILHAHLKFIQELEALNVLLNSHYISTVELLDEVIGVIDLNCNHNYIILIIRKSNYIL